MEAKKLLSPSHSLVRSSIDGLRDDGRRSTHRLSKVEDIMADEHAARSPVTSVGSYRGHSGTELCT
jgi:hypothetical protein